MFLRVFQADEWDHFKNTQCNEVTKTREEVESKVQDLGNQSGLYLACSLKGVHNSTKEASFQEIGISH